MTVELYKRSPELEQKLTMHAHIPCFVWIFKSGWDCDSYLIIPFSAKGMRIMLSQYALEIQMDWLSVDIQICNVHHSMDETFGVSKETNKYVRI